VGLDMAMHIITMYDKKILRVQPHYKEPHPPPLTIVFRCLKKKNLIKEKHHSKKPYIYIYI